MKYSKEFREKICEEYLHTDIGRIEICNKYNLPLNTVKVWLFRYYPDEYKCDKKARHYTKPDTFDDDEHIPKKYLNYKNVKDMSKTELIKEIIKKDFEIDKLKKSILGWTIRKTRIQMDKTNRIHYYFKAK